MVEWFLIADASARAARASLRQVPVCQPAAFLQGARPLPRRVDPTSQPPPDPTPRRFRPEKYAVADRWETSGRCRDFRVPGNRNGCSGNDLYKSSRTACKATENACQRRDRW